MPPTLPRLYAAFSGAALELLDTDVDVMGRNLERVVMLYEGDISPDDTISGPMRIIGWDRPTLLRNIERVMPSREFAGTVIVNFEVFERSLNPLTLGAIGDVLDTIKTARPKCRTGWYGHPRRFLWEWQADDMAGPIAAYERVFMEWWRERAMNARDVLAPHMYPIGAVVPRSEVWRWRSPASPKRYAMEDVAVLMRHQVEWVKGLQHAFNTFSRPKPPALWFYTPLIAEGGPDPKSWAAGHYDAEQTRLWLGMMRDAGIEDIAIWLHANPGKPEELEVCRRALVECVFAGLGV